MISAPSKRMPWLPERSPVISMSSPTMIPRMAPMLQRCRAAGVIRSRRPRWSPGRCERERAAPMRRDGRRLPPRECTSRDRSGRTREPDSRRQWNDRARKGTGEGRGRSDPCQRTARHRSPTDTSGEGRSAGRESSTDRCADWRLRNVVRSRSQRLWSLGAVAGIAIGLSMLIVGDRFGRHGLRLLGALITAGGLLCAVVRFAGKD